MTTDSHSICSMLLDLSHLFQEPRDLIGGEYVMRMNACFLRNEADIRSISLQAIYAQTDGFYQFVFNFLSERITYADINLSPRLGQFINIVDYTRFFEMPTAISLQARNINFALLSFWEWSEGKC